MKFLKWISIAVACIAMASCGGGGGSPGATAQGSGQSGNTNAGAGAGGTSSVTFSTTPSRAVSIAIAAGDKIDNSDPIFYEETFAATVVDTNGLPVAGAVVSVVNGYLGFFKGTSVYSTASQALSTFHFTSPNTTDDGKFFCVREDLNNDDINQGEDLNLNGTLDPAKALVSSAISGTNVTDNRGNVFIKVRYPKRYARWVNYELITRVNVQGTEGTARFSLVTSYAIGDEAQPFASFLVSPYGRFGDCTNTN